MKENLYKPSVSDWKLEFENGKIIDIITIIKEVISSESSGKTEIILNDVCFKNEIIDLFRNKVKLLSITQSFRLVNSNGGLVQECEYGYNNPEIKNLTIISESDGIAVISLTIACV